MERKTRREDQNSQHIEKKDKKQKMSEKCKVYK